MVVSIRFVHLIRRNTMACFRVLSVLLRTLPQQERVLVTVGFGLTGLTDQVTVTATTVRSTPVADPVQNDSISVHGPFVHTV